MNHVMTAQQRIKLHILKQALSCEFNTDLHWDGEITADNVDEAYESVMVRNDAHWDYEREFRNSGENSDIECDHSRHYESKSVARELSDGTWVGWTYWYGGGKHGEPQSIDWMPFAYDVEMTEKVVPVRTFSKTKAIPTREEMHSALKKRSVELQSE